MTFYLKSIKYNYCNSKICKLIIRNLHIFVKKNLKRKIIENIIACIKKNERIMTRKDHKMHTFMSWIYITCLLHNLKINKTIN